MPAVSREIRRWRVRAEGIPDAPLRSDALDSIAHKRDHAEGAALFSILPARRDMRLLRLLVAYQTIWDFLDNASERDTDEINGCQLHLALVEALDPQALVSDYYRHHPWKDDGGYLRELVETCRECCEALPSYWRVHHRVLEGVRGCAVQSANHELDPEHRDTALKAWAECASSADRGLAWFERTAAASGFTPHILLALAAEPSCAEDDIAHALRTYHPWVSLAITMLDSYSDQLEDTASGAHSYISRYGDSEIATRRLCEIVNRITREAHGLTNGHRHATIVTCMVAMYLSKTGPQNSATRHSTQRIADAGGSLTRLLLPILRLWRIAYADNRSKPPQKE